MFSISNPSRIKTAAEIISKLSSEANPVSITTPRNLLHVKNDWKTAANHGVINNPTFHYQKSHLDRLAGFLPDFDRVSAELLSGITPCSSIDTIVHEVIQDRIRDTRLTLELAAAIVRGDDAAAADCTRRKYGRPNFDQLATARLLAANLDYRPDHYESRFSASEIEKLLALRFDANGIREYFQMALDYYGITGWELVVDANASSIDVRDKNFSGHPQVVIPVDRVVSGIKLIELIGHELECHLRNSENSRQLFTRILGADSPLAPLIPLLAKPDDEKLYEGCAKMSDAKITGEKALPKPYYTLAIGMATHGESFASVANYIYEQYLATGASETAAINGAWLAAYRTFRGVTDTTNPHSYAFGKDYGYLAGFNIVRELGSEHEWMNYASLTLLDITRLRAVGIDFSKPKYPNLDAAGYIANSLLYPEE